MCKKYGGIAWDACLDVAKRNKKRGVRPVIPEEYSWKPYRSNADPDDDTIGEDDDTVRFQNPQDSAESDACLCLSSNCSNARIACDEDHHSDAEEAFGRANAGVDMTFDFPRLIAHAAKTRPLCAGTIIGSGTVSNKGPDGDPGKPVSEGGAGYSCIAEIRMIETIKAGKPSTPFMRFGDTVRIEMKDADGHSIFGAIEQTVEKA